MTAELVKRIILPGTKDFKRFWKEMGPYRYAITSCEFPPVLLEPEEWIFSNEIKALLKELMQFEKRKMKIVKSPFNPGNKNILRPGALSSWKINNFPEEWNGAVCDLFVPEGHLTQTVVETVGKEEKTIEKKDIEDAFFDCLETRIDQIGYMLFTPNAASRSARINPYLAEWERDEQDAGLL